MYLTENTVRLHYNEQPVTMLFIETIVVYCENTTGHINTLRLVLKQALHELNFSVILCIDSIF